MHSNCFGLCEYIETVILDGKIEKINDSAFNRCTHLKSLTLGININYIDKKPLQIV